MDAAQRELPAPAADPQIYYLIERNSPAEYLVNEHYGSADWSLDPFKAMKFFSKESADRFIRSTVLRVESDLRICEHMFNCGTAPDAETSMKDGYTPEVSKALWEDAPSQEGSAGKSASSAANRRYARRSFEIPQSVTGDPMRRSHWMSDRRERTAAMQETLRSGDSGHRQDAEQEREKIAQEREQHYHFTLNDFEELVEQYGAPKIFADLSEDVYWALYKNINDYAD